MMMRKILGSYYMYITSRILNDSCTFNNIFFYISNSGANKVNGESYCCRILGLYNGCTFMKYSPLLELLDSNGILFAVGKSQLLWRFAHGEWL